MKKYTVFLQCCVFLIIINFSNYCYSASKDTVTHRHKVTLPEAHIGNLEIDTRLLNSYQLLPENIRQFYFDARAVFSENPNADFTNKKIIEAAGKYNMLIMGGPMLGNLSENSVILWVRPSGTDPLVVKVSNTDGSDEKSYMKHSAEAGMEQRIVLDGLSSDTDYKYVIYAKNQKVAEGNFTTAPPPGKRGIFRLTFGSCFHKIGLHNPNLINQILKRNPQAMMLLGDLAEI